MINLGFPPPDRVLRVVSRQHCELQNISALARGLGRGRCRVHTELRRRIQTGWLRRIRSLPPPHSPETIRSDRLFLSAKAWKTLLGREPTKLRARYQRELVSSLLIPQMIERIVSLELFGKNRSSPPYYRLSHIYTMGCYRGRGIDLVIERRGGMRIGFTFENLPQDRDYRRALESMDRALTEGWIDRGFLITCETTMHKHRGGAVLIPAAVLLAYYDSWTGPRGEAVTRTMLKLYRRRLQRCLTPWHPSRPLESSISPRLWGRDDEDQRTLKRLCRRLIALLPRGP